MYSSQPQKNLDNKLTRKHTRENRDSSFAELEDGNELPRREQQVLEVIKQKGPISNRQIARTLSLDTTSVGPRTLELRRQGLVIEAKRDKDTTGKTVSFWMVAPQHYVQQKLFR